MNKTYTIKTDDQNWVIVENSTNKTTGAPTEKNIGYYATLEQLVRAAHNKMLLVHGLDNIEQAMIAAEGLVNSAVAIITDHKAAAEAKITRARATKETTP